MYRDDGLSTDDMVALLRAFPNQSLDFFGAIRASTYDNQIRDWIRRDVVDGAIAGAAAGPLPALLHAAAAWLCPPCRAQPRRPPPTLLPPPLPPPS